MPWLRAMGDAGLLGLVSATEVGGKGLGLPAASQVVGRIARECASTAMVVCMHYCATAVIEANGPVEVRKAIAAGKHLTTLAFSEVGSRSAFWVPVGTATIDGANVKLTGRKSMATSATNADSYVWSSKPTAGGELSTLWLVPRTTPGMRTPTTPFDGLGLRGNDSAPITAEDAMVPQSARLGEDGAGFGNTALLLCGNNFLLNLCEAVRFWLTPRVSFFFLGFQGRYLLRSQLFSCQKC